MTEAAQLALIAAIPTYLASLSALIASVAVLIQGLRNTEAKKFAKTVNEKTDELIVKTDEIHKVTNSTASKMAEDLKASNERILVLDELIRTLTAQIAMTQPPKFIPLPENTATQLDELTRKVAALTEKKV